MYWIRMCDCSVATGLKSHSGTPSQVLVKNTPQILIQYFKLLLNLNSVLESIKKNSFKNITVLKIKAHLRVQDCYLFPVIKMKKQLSWHLSIILSDSTNSWYCFGKVLILCHSNGDA